MYPWPEPRASYDGNPAESGMTEYLHHRRVALSIDGNRLGHYVIERLFQPFHRTSRI